MSRYSCAIGLKVFIDGLIPGFAGGTDVEPVRCSGRKMR